MPKTGILEYFRERSAELGVNQSKLAAAAGMSKRELARFMRGSFTAAELTKILKALSLDILIIPKQYYKQE